MELSIEFLIVFSIIIFFSSLVHGSIGFGFPMIATPLLAMVTDMKTAILYMRWSNRQWRRCTKVRDRD